MALFGKKIVSVLLWRLPSLTVLIVIEEVPDWSLYLLVNLYTSLFQAA